MKNYLWFCKMVLFPLLVLGVLGLYIFVAYQGHRDRARLENRARERARMSPALAKTPVPSRHEIIDN